MQLFNATNKELSLAHDIDSLCGTTSASYPFETKVRNVNQAYMDVSRVIWDCASGWQWDDANATDLPVATTNLLQSQQDYTLPTTIYRIIRVAVKDGNGVYQMLRPMDISELTLDTSQFPYGNQGMPQYYDLVANSIMLYPTPISGAAGVTLTSGMKIYFDRQPTLFSAASACYHKEPGFASPFHRILSYSAAIDFTKDNVLMQRWALQRKQLMDGLVRFYSHRGVERVNKMRPFSKKYKYTYR